MHKREGKPLKVAVGMKNHETLTEEHFGDAEFYLIFEWDGEQWKQIEKRENTAKRTEERFHGDPRKFKAVIELLSDVDVFLAYKMGPNIKRIVTTTNKIPIPTKERNLKHTLEILTNKLKEKGIL